MKPVLRYISCSRNFLNMPGGEINPVGQAAINREGIRHTALSIPRQTRLECWNEFQNLKTPLLTVFGHVLLQEVSSNPMVYVRQLAEDERQELKEMSRKEIGRVSQRAQMVLMSSKSLAVSDIADLLDVCPATVRFWVRKFEAVGPGGLYDESRSGRPRNEEGLNGDQRIEIMQTGGIASQYHQK